MTELSDELAVLLAFLAAAVITLLATPLAIRVARQTGFFDHPTGYKKHLSPTPYLGGAAVMAGFVAASLIFSDELDQLWPILAAAMLLWGIGTLDDRIGLGFTFRVVVVTVTAIGLYVAGVGWEYLDTTAMNVLFTILFILGVVNAFNLMDNIDGAAGTVGLVSSAGVGILALIQGDGALAAMCFALAGSCAGFLRYNLAKPARIFLGDGGSMPLGLIIATAIMALEGGAQVGWEMALIAVVLVGLPALDTALVIISRRRRGAGVFTGSRDHLTHRLLTPLGSTRRLAVILALGQGALCAVGIGLYEGSQEVSVIGAAACILAGIGVIALLETPRWAPALQDDALLAAERADVGVPVKGTGLRTPISGVVSNTASAQRPEGERDDAWET